MFARHDGGAQERISYGIPYYGYKGRLAYFRYTKEHIGLYVPPPVIEEHKKEIKAYGTSKATVRFPHKADVCNEFAESIFGSLTSP